VHFAFAPACVVAGLGIAAGILSGHRGSDDHAVVPFHDSALVTTAPQRSTLDWLRTLHHDLAIHPDQASAWQAYANTMTKLETSRIELDSQLKGGEARDLRAERARHAMVLASALAELERHLSPEQQTKARLLTMILAESVICRELAIQ
jgi:hypothetical protein